MINDDYTPLPSTLPFITCDDRGIEQTDRTYSERFSGGQLCC